MASKCGRGGRPFISVRELRLVVVLTVSSAGAGMGTGRQVSKREKACPCIS